ncbi:MAG TPA: alpha/beta hydrolase [Chloroflexaceae bacterium]|nr:alpha/beta hydrolase [Chloroflexaceae bacterium]
MNVDRSSPAAAVSADGTAIAYWASGNGPPLVLVHGGVGDHTRWGALTPYLEPHFTVCAMDRRGRGASGDHPDYHVEREYEDVVAVVAAAAEASGSAVAVYGSSYGGLCAFGAATRTEHISRLMLYEGWPPVNPAAFAPPTGFLERTEALLAEGKGEAVLEMVFREVVKMSEAELDAYRAHPSWPARVATAHTFPREERAFAQARFDPQQAARIAVPTLLLTGSESPDWYPEVETVAAALPDARVAVLEGQGHVADVVAPELVAAQLLAFLER